MSKVLPSVFAVIVGVVLGATVALLWVNSLDYRWVDATGTWFGGIATVLTLLWAVHVFRKDQDHREQERILRHLESLGAERQQEHEAAAEAADVDFQLLGGRAFGPPGEMNLEQIRVKVTNTTDRTASVTEIQLDEPLKFARSPELPLRVPPHDTIFTMYAVEDVSIADEESMGRPLTSYGARIVYSINGNMWTRRNGEAPSRYEDSASSRSTVL